jgi:hypothetical protein
MTGIRRVVNTVLGLVLSSVLVVGVVQPANASAFDVKGVAKSVSTPEPLLPDGSATPKAPPAEAPQSGDFSNPPADSTSIAPVPAPASAEKFRAADITGFDKSTAKVVSEGAFERTYQGPGDTKMTEFSDVPLNVKVDGAWKPVVTDLSGRGPFAFLGKGGAEVSQNPLAPVFAEHSDESLSLTWWPESWDWESAVPWWFCLCSQKYRRLKSQLRAACWVPAGFIVSAFGAAIAFAAFRDSCR